MDSSQNIIGSLPEKPPRSHVRVSEPQVSDLEIGADALTETVAVAAGKSLDNRKQTNEVRKLLRQDISDHHVHRITLWYIYFFAFMGIVSLGVVFFHYLSPISWHFLVEDQIVRIQELLLSGGAGIFIEKAARRVN
jgi:hypothetical protein